AVGEKQNAARSLNGIAEINNRLGRPTEALEHARHAANLADQIGSVEEYWQARTTAGQAYRALNQPEPARQAFADAIDTIEKLRGQVAGGEQQQQRFFEDKVSPYYEMVDLLIGQDQSAAALAYAERAKGRVLLDVLSGGRTNITKAMTPAEQVQERALN